MAARESNGSITFSWHMGGFSVNAGRRSFGPEADPRAIALNIHCLEELVRTGLAEKGSQTHIYLTSEGFDLELIQEISQAPVPQYPAMTPSNAPLVRDVLLGAVEGKGRVMFSSSMSGSSLQAGCRMWESDGNRQIVARWKSVLREMVETGLLLPRSEQVFIVSHLGYLWTDALNAKESVA